ncbi:MAG: hypothetical protein P4L31_02640 [Candidatus Babeliales bacterium]|nr:hypothetical protein [Candidatus Babeliales bacterium]
MNNVYKKILLVFLLGIMNRESTCDASYTKEQKFVLIISLYNETDRERMQEYITCFEHNLKHPLIHGIHVLYDTSKDSRANKLLQYLESKKIKMSYITSRPTYASCFDLANKLYPNSKIILSNADIYFNETLEDMASFNLTDKFLALTRWNVKKDGSIELFKQYYGGALRLDMSYASQDTWMFKTPLKKFKEANIKLGTMTCDTLISYQAWASGLDVFNPCLSIQCCHLHLSEIRHYDTWSHVMDKPLKILPWVTLYNESIPEYPVITELRNPEIYYKLQKDRMNGIKI